MVPLALTAVTQAALREYLERRGFLPPPAGRAFEITLAEKGSGSKDISAEHDRCFAEAERAEKETLGWLALSEIAFSFWENEEDEVWNEVAEYAEGVEG